MEAFKLRLWDGRLGQWLTSDPYGEFDSPYLGMGNNPISLIDPDGGSTEGGPGDPPPGKMLEEVVVKAPKSDSSFLGMFRQIGDMARNFQNRASSWASDYSKSHSDIGAGDIWRRQMEPVKEMYGMGFGPTGVGLANTRSFAKFVPKGYTVAAEKFDYFFGRVTSSPENMRRSLQNLSDLNEMGITSQNALIRVFNKAFSSGKQVRTQVSPHGTTITKQIQVGDHALNVGFFTRMAI